MNTNDEFGPIPNWLQVAQAAQDVDDAAKQTDLAKCQALIARLRRAMTAAGAAMVAGAAPAAEIDRLLLTAAQADPLGEEQRQAVERLEELAGWTAKDGEGEVYP